MRTTFYIASAPDNFVAVRTLGDFLTSRGWRWSPGNAWERRAVWDGSWVSRDMNAALTADVFILMLSNTVAVGAHAQLGARWGARRTIFGIRQGGEAHPLHDLPEIVWFDSSEDFAQAVFGP